MLDSWLKSEPYQELRAAAVAADAAWQCRIYETTIACMEGPEKAFWMLLRHAFKRGVNGFPVNQSWSDLEAALREAPDHPVIREMALVNALELATITQNLSQFFLILRAFRLDYRKRRHTFWFRNNVAVLQMERGRWKAAYRNYTLAIPRLEGNVEAMEHSGGYLHTMYAMRSVTALACGEPEQAAADVETACAAAMSRPVTRVHWLTLALAKAELAFHHGDWETARAELQLGLIKDRTVGWWNGGPMVQARAELLAARMARAEGNQKGFEHFCGRALELARQKNLPLSAARARAVLAGADR